MLEKDELDALYLNFWKYFSPEEIVSPAFYEKYKAQGKDFFLSRFDIRLIANMVVIREAIDKPITINNWKWGGPFSQRGLRDLSTDMVKNRVKKNDTWASGHLFGKALDFDVEGMTAEEVRAWLVEEGDMLPFPIRLERKMKGKQITWVHLDVCYNPKDPWVYEFDI